MMGGMFSRRVSRNLFAELLAAYNDNQIDQFKALLALPDMKSGILNRFADTTEERTLLYCACRDGKVEFVRALLSDKRVNVNLSAKNGMTPLYSACLNNRENVVVLLVAHPKIDINKATQLGFTPLYVACENGRLELVRRLMSHSKIEPHSQTEKGADRPYCTAFQVACTEGHLAIIEFMVSFPRFSFSSAAESGLSHACTGGHLEIFKFLAERVKKSSWGMQNVIYAVFKSGRIEFFNYILSKTVLFSMKDMWRVACAVNQTTNIQFIEILLNSPYVERLFDSGVPVVHYALESGKKEIVDLVLDIPNIDVNGLHEAFHSYYIVETTPLTALCSSVKIDRSLFSAGYHLEMYRNNSQAHRELCEFFIADRRVDVNKRARGDSGDTPLFTACHVGNLPAVQALLRHPNLDFSLKCLGTEYKTALEEASGLRKYHGDRVHDDMQGCEITGPNIPRIIWGEIVNEIKAEIQYRKVHHRPRNPIRWRAAAVSPGSLLELEPGLFPMTSSTSVKSTSLYNIYQAQWGRRVVQIKQLKISTLTPAAKREFFSQLTALASLSDSHATYVLSVYGACRVPGNLYYVSEYMMSVSLIDWLSSNREAPWERFLALARNVITAMISLNEKGICYSGIEAKDICVANDRAFVENIDFPLLKSEAGVVSATAYMAPEVLQGLTSTSTSTSQSDIYSVGVLLAVFGMRSEPFSNLALSSFVMMKTIIDEDREIEKTRLRESAPPKFAKLVFSCWDKAVSRRPSLHEVGDVIFSADLDAEALSLRK